MKNTILPLSILLSLLLSCSSGSNDLDRSGLLGKVKSVKEMQFEATHEGDRWVAGEPLVFGASIVNFDESGHYLESYIIRSTGDTIGKSTCIRKDGEMVEEQYSSLLDRSTSRTILERVSKEQVNFEVYQNGNRVTEGANYVDGKGRLLRQVQVGGDREVTIYHVWEKNLLVENYMEEITGERTATRQYEYDEFDDKGNWTLKLQYSGESKITPELAITREISYY